MRRGVRRRRLRRTGGQRPAKKPRLDPALNRPSWVSGSVSEAVRMDGRGQMRPPRPYNKWRVKSCPYGVGGHSGAHFTASGHGF